MSRLITKAGHVYAHRFVGPAWEGVDRLRVQLTIETGADRVILSRAEARHLAARILREVPAK